MTECIALIRGINVGRAKRVAMSELRDLVAALGHGNVRTLLNSGNVVFEAASENTGKVALGIQLGIASTFGISARVVVLTAAELMAIVRDNPLLELAGNPSRFLVAFVSDPILLTKVKPLADESWAPERLAVGTRAAYLWCANGILESKLLQAFARATGESATTRNWSTVLKLNATVS
jgi:uncharacterized protein (DUF1697 family)